MFYYLAIDAVMFVRYDGTFERLFQKRIGFNMISQTANTKRGVDVHDLSVSVALALALPLMMTPVRQLVSQSVGCIFIYA